jgi:hypothetical protein
MGTSFLSWKRDLDKLKAVAIEQTFSDEDVKPSDNAKSIMASAQGKTKHEWMSIVKKAVRTDPNLGKLTPAPGCVIYGWRVLLSRARVGDGKFLWHLSASKGSAPTEQDRQRLGKILAHVGAPSTPFYVPDDPSEAHHWQWAESVS